MDRKERHKHLTALLKDSENIKSSDAALLWLDSVAPLLKFSDEYYTRFQSKEAILRMSAFSQSMKESAWEACVSIVRQATYSLEIDLEKSVSPPEPVKPKPIPPPEKLTARWLFDHAPLSWWAWLGGALLTAGGIGVSIGQSTWYSQISERKTPTASQPPIAEKTSPPATSNESMKIDSKTKSAP